MHNVSKKIDQVFRALMEVTPSLIVLLDSAGRIIKFNKACEALTGYSRDEVTAKNPLDFLVPDKWIDAVRNRFSDPFSPEVAKPHENPWLTKAGEERLIRWQCSALSIIDGEPPYILGIGTDVTEQTLAEEEFRRQKRLMELFFESILHCAALLDKNFNYIRVNQAYAQACQRDPCDFPGCNHFDLYPSDAKAIFDDVVRTKQPYTARARPFEFPDHPEWGVTYWDWTLVPVVDCRGEVEMLLFCPDDVTKRQRVEENLRYATGQLQQLSMQLVEIQESERRRLARILHDEIGQELTAIKLAIQNQIHALHGGGDDRLHGALNGVNEIIGRVRQISLDLRPTVLDDLGLIPALVWLIDRQRSLAGLEVSFRHHGLDVRLSQEMETAVYRIVQEALTNIVSHADVLRATLLMWVTDEELIFSIADPGRGFDLNTAMSAGTGGGLLGMRERARMLGGRVTIETTPGAGTTITANLPMTLKTIVATESQ